MTSMRCNSVASAGSLGASIGAMPIEIEFIVTPETLRGKYQYFTEASMEKLRAAGYSKPFTSLDDAVSDYVASYLNLQEKA